MKKIKIGLSISIPIIFILLILNIFLTLYSPFSQTTEQIFDENILKVVEIKVSDDEETWGYATGCFIDKHGTIITNKHVVFNTSTNENFQIIQVRLANEENWIEAEIKKISQEYDIALIKIEKNNTHYFTLEKNYKNGETIYTIGNPNNFGLSFTSGVISSKLKIVSYNSEQTPTIQTSLVINEGNSGGPVFNKSGKLIGIISFRLKDKYGDVIQGVSFAIPANIIKDFIE